MSGDEEREQLETGEELKKESARDTGRESEDDDVGALSVCSESMSRRRRCD